jgi:hypothetical protein
MTNKIVIDQLISFYKPNKKWEVRRFTTSFLNQTHRKRTSDSRKRPGVFISGGLVKGAGQYVLCMSKSGRSVTVNRCCDIIKLKIRQLSSLGQSVHDLPVLICFDRSGRLIIVGPEHAGEVHVLNYSNREKAPTLDPTLYFSILSFLHLVQQKPSN